MTSISFKIPPDRLEDVLSECERWSTKALASRKDLQRLAGRLQHIAKCIRPARRFMARILLALRETPARGRHLIRQDLKLDVAWFSKFARIFNGTVLIPPLGRDQWVIECDSSLKAGGGHSPGGFYSAPYSDQLLLKGYSIAQLEALNLVTALKALSPPVPAHYDIIVNTDNITSQQVLESGSGKDLFLCTCAREIWLFAARLVPWSCSTTSRRRT